MAATAKETPAKNILYKSCPCSTPIPTTNTVSASATTIKILPNCSNFRWRGVIMTSAFWSKSAICPIAVFIPIPTTIPVPLPLVTRVPINAILSWSPSGTSSPGKAFICLATGKDSPVSADSSISRLLASIIRRSAPMRSPLENFTMSPTTSSLDGNLTHFPSRMAATWGAESSFNAWRDFSAFLSWKKPRNPLITTMAIIAIASMYSPKRPEISVAASKTSTIKSLNCSTNTRMAGFFSPSVNSLNPCCCWRAFTSLCVRPCCLSVFVTSTIAFSPNSYHFIASFHTLLFVNAPIRLLQSYIVCLFRLVLKNAILFYRTIFNYLRMWALCHLMVFLHMAFYKNYLRPWFQDEFQKYISRFQTSWFYKYALKVKTANF